MRGYTWFFFKCGVYRHWEETCRADLGIESEANVVNALENPEVNENFDP